MQDIQRQREIKFLILVNLRTILGNAHAARGVASISLAFYDVGFCFAAAICCERFSYVDLLFKLATERTISCQAPLAACAISVLMQQMPRELYFVEPRDCKSVETLPSGDDWQYETKFDGYRAVAIKQHGQVKLYSRRGNSFTNIYPQVVDASRGPAGKIIYSRWRISSS